MVKKSIHAKSKNTISHRSGKSDYVLLKLNEYKSLYGTLNFSAIGRLPEVKLSRQRVKAIYDTYGKDGGQR